MGGIFGSITALKSTKLCVKLRFPVTYARMYFPVSSPVQKYYQNMTHFLPFHDHNTFMQCPRLSNPPVNGWLIMSYYWIVMLSMVPALFKTVPARRLRMPAVAQTAICDLFISPAHLTKPERWPLPEGPYTKGWLTAIFNIRNQWQDPEI